MLLGAMPRRLDIAVLVVALMLSGELAAQNRVRTETITPPPQPPAPSGWPPPGAIPPGPGEPGAAAAPARPGPRIVIRPQPTKPSDATPEVVADLSRLPPPVARMRARILEAARSGDLDKVVTVMQSNETMPVFSLGADKNPTTFWKTSYPDSDGIEILAILIGILEAGFVHLDYGSPQEMFVWPYFAQVPLKDLTPPQKVELFKVITGSDYKAMREAGAYKFYRVGIAPDGTWHFFLSGH
jgi:hypothetical protein